MADGSLASKDAARAAIQPLLNAAGASSWRVQEIEVPKRFSLVPRETPAEKSESARRILGEEEASWHASHTTGRGLEWAQKNDKLAA